MDGADEHAARLAVSSVDSCAGIIAERAETGRTWPYQVDSDLSLPVWEQFPELLPARPYCTNEPACGLVIRGREQALSFSHIQLNHPAIHRWLPFDLDDEEASTAWERAQLATPNVVIVNPSNGHAHLVYALADPVHALPRSRLAPLRYLADIERGMLRRLKADPGYSGLVTKNPFSSRWRPQWLAPYGYRLEQLDCHLTKADKRRPSKPELLSGLGRNCLLFDELRDTAYREAVRFKARGLSQAQFLRSIEEIAHGLNQQFAGSIAGPLSWGEVRGIARSVARFCWRHFSTERFSEIQRYRAQTRTRRHLEIVERIKNDGA